MTGRRSKPRPYHYKQPLTYLLLEVTLAPGFNQAIMGFTRPLWIMGISCVSHVMAKLLPLYFC